MKDLGIAIGMYFVGVACCFCAMSARHLGIGVSAPHSIVISPIEKEFVIDAKCTNVQVIETGRWNDYSATFMAHGDLDQYVKLVFPTAGDATRFKSGQKFKLTLRFEEVQP